MKQVKKVKKPVTKKIVKRKRRRIRKSVVIGFLAIIILISALIFYPKYKTNKQLKELGYDSTAITAIKKQKLTKTIISNGYYSQYLNDSIKDNTLKIEYKYLDTPQDDYQGSTFKATLGIDTERVGETYSLYGTSYSSKITLISSLFHLKNTCFSSLISKFTEPSLYLQ